MHNLWKKNRFWNSVIEATAVSMRFLCYALKIDYWAVCVCMCVHTHTRAHAHSHASEPRTWTMVSAFPIKNPRSGGDLLMLPWNQTKYRGYRQPVCLDFPGFLFKRHLFSNSRRQSVQHEKLWVMRGRRWCWTSLVESQRSQARVKAGTLTILSKEGWQVCILIPPQFNSVYHEGNCHFHKHIDKIDA